MSHNSTSSGTTFSPDQAGSNVIERLQAISNAFVTITSELNLEPVLQLIADTACKVAGARYAALGIVDDQGVITAFITSGITREQRELIGDLPRGHGLLGVLIKQGQPVRVKDINKDPRRHGFPAHHPPMTSLLGVPVSIQDRIVGDLYLTDKIGADEFSAEDEWWLTIFARQAAVAVENANLYRRVQLAHRQARMLAELSGSLNRSTEPAALFRQITSAACDLLEKPASAVYLLNTTRTTLEMQAQRGLLASDNISAEQPVQFGPARQLLELDRAVTLSGDQELSGLNLPLLEDGSRPAAVLASPIRQSELISGVIYVYSRHSTSFTDEEISLLDAFATKAGLALEKAQLYQQKQEFLSMTAHDLRAPLSAIKMSAGLLEANLPEDMPPAFTRLVNNISRNTERLNNMLTDLLDLTRLEQGSARFNLERQEFGEALSAAAASLALLFENKLQTFKISLPDQECWILADRLRLDQALVNLMINANKYTPEGGEISLTLIKDNNFALAALKDSGPGVPMSEQSRIFDRFYRQAVHERTGEITGSGLGLPISRLLIEQQGGQLWVESEPGQGSTFLIKFPLI